MRRFPFQPGEQGLSAVAVVQVAIGLSVLALWVDFDLSTVHVWRVVAYALVTYIAAVFYDISERSRVVSNLEGLLFLSALFLLNPTEVIIGRVLGGYFGDRAKVRTPHKVWANSAAQFMVITIIVAVFDQVFPNADLATTSAKEIVLAGLVVFGVYEALVPVWVTFFSLGNYGYVTPRMLRDRHSTQFVIGVEFALGILVVVALAISPWLFIPIAVVTSLVIFLALRSARHWVLRTGMDHILELTRSANSTSDPAETFASVRRSVEKIGTIADVVVASIDGQETIRFDPAPGSVIAREVRNPQRLREFAEKGAVSIAAVGSTAGSIGVWRLSEATEDYLIVYSDQKLSSVRNFWQTVDILSQHAALVHTTTSQRRALEQQAQFAHDKARFDEVVGLPNRLGLIEWLEAELAEEEPLIIVALRVNGLADMQQVLGERAANAELRDFAHRALVADPFSFVARVRDDVFVLVSKRPVVEVASVVRRIVSSEEHQSDALRAVAAGIVDVATAAATDAEGLLSDCWAALSRADRRGHKVALFDDSDAAAARRRFAIGTALPQAIEQDQIVPFFQPQIDIATGALIGCEVLARWIHPELGFVSPVEFIEVAEQSNLIEPLTEQILQAACEARARWMRQGLNVGLSVNVSARSLLQPAFVEHIAGLFASCDLGKGDLTVEITESTIAEDDAITGASLELLHRVGAKISIDDFGTGYSALAYLHRLPVDEVKIDKSMVMALGERRDPTDVVAGLIKICHSLGIRVVAEGVETDDALERLEALDCDIAQGYFFAKPMPEADWCQWVLQWQERSRPRATVTPLHGSRRLHG